MATEASRLQTRLSFEEIATYHPWQAVLLPVTQFPMPRFYLEQLCTFLQALDEVLVKDHRLQQEVLYQVWKIAPGNGSEILNDNIETWSPDLGLGIWPNRKPPQSWTEELLVDAAAAHYRGDEPEMPSHRLLRNVVDERKRIDAAGNMRGFAVQIEFFSKEKLSEIIKRGKDIFLPAITERRFKKEDFYLPLLDRKTIAAAESAEQLDAWLCGIDVYVRESAEDKGILILSKLPLQPLFERVQERMEEALLTEEDRKLRVT